MKKVNPQLAKIGECSKKSVSPFLRGKRESKIEDEKPNTHIRFDEKEEEKENENSEAKDQVKEESKVPENKEETKLEEQEKQEETKEKDKDEEGQEEKDKGRFSFCSKLELILTLFIY